MREDLFGRLSEKWLLWGIEELNHDICEMPVDITKFESFVKKQSFKILTIGAIGTWVCFSVVENEWVSLIPALTTFFLYKQKKAQAFQDFEKQFKGSLEKFVSESQIYAIPFIQSTIIQILKIADKENFSDVEVTQAITDLKDFFYSNDWKPHFDLACQRHPYINAWLIS